MTISNTYDFNPDIGEIMEEAFERAGVELRSGNDFRTARRSYNYLALEWAVKGVNLWTVDEQSISSATITQGAATYDIDIDTLSILNAVIRTDAGDTSLQSDLTVTRISRSTYSQIPNKLSEGRPLQFYYEPIGIKDRSAPGTDRVPQVTLWPIPDESNKYTFVYWRAKRIADAGSTAANTADVPDRFLPALVAGLAYHIACKKPESAGRVPRLEAQYEKAFMEAADDDREKVDMVITPDVSGYGR